ncbi:MAG: hypothetical protein ACFFFB_23395, partial [Candidatus Heimdallarchaeota archaeon]
IKIIITNFPSLPPNIFKANKRNDEDNRNITMKSFVRKKIWNLLKNNTYSNVFRISINIK